mgnify:CR=1 FL=1|tara:strand:- start:231 stop:716 length:486 start_codon:yes stop_codon:yes gene_type:complete
MSKTKNKTIFNLILVFSVFALIIAYFIQYSLGYQPCNLCLIERIPYILAVIIILLYFFLKKFEKVFLIILSLIFLFAALISFYHFGIEQGFIKESFVCELNQSDKVLTVEELLKELNEQTISCKNVTFKILGMSLATINTIISLIISVIVFKAYFYYEKNR